METLIPAIDEMWVAIHGPMKEFIIDGETALVKGWQSRAYFSRKGIKVIVRAPGVHAHYIERRGALTRDTLHKVDSQLAAEGIVVPIEQRVSETIFAGNALISINNTTPYNALYGRVPNILPDINAAPVDTEGDLPGTIRHAQRLREVAVQRMIEGTAHERVGRALRTRTLPAAQQTYQEGDTVDFFRPPSNKDLPGWSGPATLTDMSQVNRGIIKVTYNGRELVCSPKDMRIHQAYLCFLAAPHYTNHVDRAYSDIRMMIEQMQPGKITTLGLICPKRSTTKPISGEVGPWLKTAETQRNAKVWNATQHVASQLPDVRQVVAARYGKGTAILPSVSEYHTSLLLIWPKDHPDNIKFHWLDPSSVFNFRQSIGAEWEATRWFQLLCVNGTPPQAQNTQAEANTAEVTAAVPAPEAVTAEVNVGDPLSPIQEGDNEDAMSEQSLLVYNTSDEQLVKHGKLALQY